MITVYSISCLKLINKSLNKQKMRADQIFKKIKPKLHQNKTSNYKCMKVKKLKINKFNK